MTNRERFEAWARSQAYSTETHDGEYDCPMTNDLWQAWQAACPGGWQCVPVETTDEMVEAALDAYAPFGVMRLAIEAAVAHAPEPGDWK